ncbi:ATPase AAA [Bacillus coahuilensis p1.1.43]|uniref:ATPase AAA n=1 Tax=Bacillus coahuilensis p1.1.43 TaxID=1150625 RepID=A0A147KC65_9BACI|nr:DNA topology modulation protein [Bacillus coahuilensis]KUP09203.1 ATPase AAA [Bacillus coahuilensis p1.1.43]
MNKIMLIGSGGAGKSTFARQLGQTLNIPVYHLDSLLWKPNWVLSTREEQRAIQSELVEKESWVIDGNYSATMDIRLQAADTIIFIDLPAYLCVYRVIKRRFHYHNQTRPDMREGCNERLDLEFVKWVWRFPRDKKPHLIKKLREFEKDKNIYVLKSKKEVQGFLDTV